MSDQVIQVKYEELAGVAQRLSRSAQSTMQLRNQVTRAAKALEQGGWQGRGATAFFAEMNGVVYPGFQRLIGVLEEARAVTVQASEIMRRAEDDAARLFRNGASIATTNMTSQATRGGSGGGFLGAVGDFFTGVWKEGKDTVLGLVNMVIHPIETAKGIGHAITHPGEFWEAFKQPYVEAWEDGRPWEAVGRGVMFLGSALVGTKGADKAGKAAKASQAARVATDAAEVGRTLRPVEAATEIGRATVGSSKEAALARYVAEESTHRAGAAERVVLGGYRPNPARNFEGYIKEAESKGGIYYSTTSEVWDVIRPRRGHGRAWPANREFLQSQLESGVSRIELKGETVAEVLSDPYRKLTYTAQEIQYLQRHAYEYGYKFNPNENAWIKVGDWRASDAGRAAGAGVGTGASLVDEAQSLNQHDETSGRMP